MVMPFLLDPAGLEPLGGPRVVGRTGTDHFQVDWPAHLEPLDTPLYCQAVVHDPMHETSVLTELRCTRALR